MPTDQAIAIPQQKRKLNGVIIKQVLSDSAAQALGLQADDIIFMVNKQTFSTSPNTIASFLDTIESVIAKKKKKVTIYYLRSKSVKQVVLPLGAFRTNFHSKSCP